MTACALNCKKAGQWVRGAFKEIKAAGVLSLRLSSFCEPVAVDDEYYLKNAFFQGYQLRSVQV